MEPNGVVRITEQMRVELPWHRWRGSWQPDPDAPAETLYSEEGPGWNDVEGAIAWGRRHAPVVLVRRGEGLSRVHDAGERDGGRARDVHPDYAGTVWIDEEQPILIPTGKFRAVWEPAGRRPREHGRLFDDVEEAIDWARGRAPVVLVAELPSRWSGVVPAYVIRSAGDVDPEGEPVERLRPRPGRETLEWAASIQRAVNGEPAEFAARLESALREDATVSNVHCGLDASPLPEWVDVSFHVAAPFRKRAFEIALGALHRALRDAGETDSGWAGNLDLRAVD